MPRALSTRHKLILDFAPLALFLIAFKLGGVMIATACLIAATTVCLGVIYAIERKIAIMPLITAAIVLIFGGLTLWLHDDHFIKMKPTIIYGMFSAILLGGVLFKRGLLHHVLGISVQITEQGWLTLSRRWGFFFLFLAGLNEAIWRNFSTDTWVDFKVFGAMGLIMLFAMSQYKLIEQHKI